MNKKTIHSALENLKFDTVNTPERGRALAECIEEILPKYDPKLHNRTAVYLSSLVRNSAIHQFKGREILFDLRNLNKIGVVLDLVGVALRDVKLTVFGDVGDRLANNCHESEIYVYGNVGDRIGWNSDDCRILIAGNYKGVEAGVWSKTGIWHRKPGEEYSERVFPLNEDFKR